MTNFQRTLTVIAYERGLSTYYSVNRFDSTTYTKLKEVTLTVTSSVVIFVWFTIDSRINSRIL